MPRKYITEHTVYTYAELSDSAKAKARDWFREATAGDNFFAEHVTEDFHETLKALGFDPYVLRGKYADSKRARTCSSTVQWSGFWSQGDGASFGGTWHASDCDPTAFLADRPPVWPAESGGHECPANKELHRIAAEILACKAAGLEFAALSQSHRGYFMSLNSADHAQPEAITDIDEWDDACAVNEARFIEAARDLAHAFYKALEAEYEYQNSDACVTETIEANGYEFTEEGERA